MNLSNMFETLDECGGMNMRDDDIEIDLDRPIPAYTTTDVSKWVNDFGSVNSKNFVNSMNGYISPYISENWSGASPLLSNIVDDGCRLPAFGDNKVDPNRIFNSDVASLKALAADQQRITKLFEKKLIEGLSEKGKVGLTEVDIEALQALTSARSAITSINKEQVTIKKNIADIRIKQAQNQAKHDMSNQSSDNNSKPTSSADVGRMILDSIFDTAVPVNDQIQVDPNVYDIQTPDSIGTVIDDIVSNTSGVSVYTKYETMNPTTYVVMSRTGSDSEYEFETYSDDGEIIVDYPKQIGRAHV